ncbi:SDR family NAD(P)-dependent oxidoreductase [Mesobacterium pallidum]|uniref:SDR family NAD(P)-dependent oxidoreductase n=1 Tax=Mesobacterium pallidum TaxID=2872037 RepID=UPI001EE15651|nr:SDR family oxidoreductase [Mesobacterium pallidum]
MSVIITGAASGIGFATAELFATRPHGEGPARLFLADRDAGGLERAAEALTGLGADVGIAVADLSDPKAGASIVAQAVARFGSLQALVSNAGAIHRAPLTELGAEAFDMMMAINVRATLLLGQAAHPHLSASRGAIVATASSAADHPAIPLGAYSTSKAALVMLVRQMAGEWGPAGIRCNCVSPGPTHTAMTAASYDDPAVREARGQDIPMGRVGRPQDLARAIHFLAGPESDHISGINLRVDGALDAVLGVSRSGAANRI